MDKYEGCVIKEIRKFPNKGETLYACLYSSSGELLISATLDYIVKALNSRLSRKK